MEGRKKFYLVPDSSRGYFLPLTCSYLYEKRDWNGYTSPVDLASPDLEKYPLARQLKIYRGSWPLTPRCARPWRCPAGPFQV